MGEGQRITTVSLLLSVTVASALEHPVTPNWRIESKIQNQNFINQQSLIFLFGKFRIRYKVNARIMLGLHNLFIRVMYKI